MSRYCCYELRGWNSDGKPLAAPAKDELLELLEALGTDDYGSDAAVGSHYIDAFTTETQSAAGEVYNALTSYTELHPELLLEMEFVCQEENIHSRIRFQNGCQESVDAVISFPPFQKLLLPSQNAWILTDDDTLQHIRPIGDRRFECIDSGMKPNGLFFVCYRVIDLDDYEMDDDFCETYLHPYGYECEASMRRDYELAADQPIAECILETEMWEQQEMIHAGTEDDCRAFILHYVGQPT